MKKHIVLLTIALTFLSLFVQAQNDGDFTVPLSDPSKRAKVKVDIKYGSITIKGTARKDILVKYEAEKDEDEERSNGGRSGLRKIGGGTMELEV